LIKKFKNLFLLVSFLSLISITGCGLKGPLKLPETDVLFKESFDERP